MATTPEKPHRRPGRPTKAEEVRQTLAELGVDPASIDPLRILAAIAADGSMPATARVAACKVLLGQRDSDPAESAEAAAGDMATRAIQLMTTRKAAH